MDKRLLFLLAFLGTVIYSWAYPVTSSVKYDFTVDDIYYRYNADGQSVAVTYNNKGKTYSFSNLPASYTGDVVIPASVTYNETTYSVTKIDLCAFLRCSDVTSVQLPSSIVEIGDCAFESCYSLATINLPNNLAKIGNGAFSSCRALTTIVLPSSLESVNGFAGCSGLTSVTIPEGITAISDEAFSGCSGLETISLPSTLQTLGKSAFNNCKKLGEVTIPANVTKIGDGAFRGCTALSSATLLCELREFDTETGQFLNVGNQNNGIFYQCGEIDLHIQNANTAITLLLTGAFNEYYLTNLSSKTNPRFLINNAVVTELSIPNGITTIPAYSFSGVRGITSVTFPTTLKTIGTGAFYGCASLSTLSFLDALESIGESAFYDCTALTTVNFGKGLKEVGYSAFGNCTNINTVDIGDLRNWCAINFSLTNYNYDSNSYVNNPLEFAKKIYLNGSLLNELTIPDGVESIGALAFPKCQKFDKLTIPNSVKSIGDYAFAGCSDMDQVTIGNGLETIGKSAFRLCIGLKTVILPNSVAEIGASAFYQCSNLQSITLPNALTDIPSHMLYECGKLSSVTLPETTRTIGNWALYKCSSLTRIDIPATVEIIGTEAFKGCTGLTGVYISDLAAWCGIKFGNYQYQGSNWEPDDKESNPLICAKNLYLNNQLVTDLVIPDGVETIEAFTFWKAECIQTIQIPEGVKTIGKGAFMLCSNVTSINLPVSLETAEEKAFAYIVGSQKQTIKLYVKDLSAWFSNNLGYGFREAGNYGHYNCFDLYVNEALVKNLVVPKNIKKLNKYDITGMDLNTATLHDGVESLYSSTFYRSSINYVYSKAKFAPALYNNSETQETNSFDIYFKAEKIYVPVGCGDKYKSKWSAHEAIIYETDIWPYGEEDEPAVTVTVTNCERLYGAENPTFEYTVTGGELNGTPALSCEATVTSPVGEYDITIAKGTISNTNYTLVPGKLIVNKAPLTIKADDKSKNYGEENPELTCSYDGFVNEETNSVLTTQPTLTTTATKESEPGTYEISVDGAEAANYEITYVYGTLTVNTNDPEDDIIKFKDEEVKRICVANWDTSGDGEISYKEAKAVTDLNKKFANNSIIESFDELQYFTGLKALNYDNGGQFDNCEKLESITLPEGLEKIGEATFNYCRALKGINIPASVTEMSYLGGWYYDMTTITVAAGNTVYYSPNNCNAVIEKGTNTLISGCNKTVIPNGVEVIGPFAFNACVTDPITIPTSVTTIGRSAFSTCQFTEVTLPSSVTSIDISFIGCSLIKKVVSNIAEPFAIGDATFDQTVYNNATLWVLTDEAVSKYAITDGWKNFKNIKSLLINVIMDDNDDQQDYFSGECKYNDDNTLEIVTVDAAEGDVEIPSTITVDDNQVSVTSIADGAFADNTSITTVTIPESITSIGDGAFSGCDNLEYVDLSNASGLTGLTVDDVDRSGNGAFGGLSEETVIVLPEAIATTDAQNLSEAEPNIVYKDGDSYKSENVALKDGGVLTVPESITNVTASSITYARAFNRNDVVYSICLPYTQPVTEGLMAYELHEFTNEGALVFKEVNVIEDRKPYLITSSGSVDNISATDVVMYINGNNVDKDVTGYKFCGTLKRIPNSEAIGCLILQSDKKWHPITSGSVAIPAGRAYLQPVVAGARAIIETVFMDDDDVTCIKTINFDGTATYYDLQGRRISKPTKTGIYVKDGKKVAVE